jgi:hypothetical protein
MWYLIGCIGLLALGLGIWLLQSRESDDARAMRLFRHRREQLEAKFFDLAASLGKPRGLRWTKCDWGDEVAFARDVESGLLTAFAAVQIHFEAIEGSDMEDLEAVGHFREASAVFHYQNGTWGTGGKALFNMGPIDAVQRLAGQYEPVKINE